MIYCVLLLHIVTRAIGPYAHLRRMCRTNATVQNVRRLKSVPCSDCGSDRGHDASSSSDALLFCFTCTTLTCRPCSALLHQRSAEHDVASITDAAGMLRPALIVYSQALISGSKDRRADLARLRTIIDAAPEHLHTALETVSAYVDSLDDPSFGSEKGRLHADCESVSATLVSAAREQEQRTVGTIHEAQLMVDVIAGMADCADTLLVIMTAISSAATKSAIAKRVYPVTYCVVEFIPMPIDSQCIGLDGTLPTCGRVVSADVDMVRHAVKFAVLVSLYMSATCVAYLRMYSGTCVVVVLPKSSSRSSLIRSLVRLCSCVIHVDDDPRVCPSPVLVLQTCLRT